jgi:hypothetical protein
VHSYVTGETQVLVSVEVRSLNPRLMKIGKQMFG